MKMKSMSIADAERRGKVNTVTGISEIKWRIAKDHLECYMNISYSDGDTQTVTGSEDLLKKKKRKLIKKYEL